MTLGPGLRKLTLTAHVTTSVGWLGAVVAFLGLAVAGLTNPEAQTVRGASLGMEMTARFAIVPLSVASLATGMVQSLTTTWGLFRHYWVVAKLLINVFANIVLLMYMPTLRSLGTVAAQASVSSRGLQLLRDPSPVLHSSAALVLLLVATALSVYKPRALTRYGWRKQREQRAVLVPQPLRTDRP
ncbi:MAG: DUF2269 domain-containing protein [Actinomycetota bacterium]